jgi:hypothetical protein
LKEGEKISNLENASCNLIPLTICKKIFPKGFAKTKQVVQAWSKMLKERKQSMQNKWSKMLKERKQSNIQYKLV